MNEQRPHSAPRAWRVHWIDTEDNYLAWFQATRRSGSAPEEGGEVVAAEDYDSLVEQLRTAKTTLAHAEAFIEHQDMSYRWAEWCEGRDPETSSPSKGAPVTAFEIGEAWAEPRKKVWYCKIGEVDPDDVPQGGDLPMREAAARAYKRITGEEPEFIFSGWGAVLTEGERAVVEDRLPDSYQDRTPDVPDPGSIPDALKEGEDA